MGQSSSNSNTSPYATVTIQCDRELYCAGEIIHGTVVLNVTQSFPLATFAAVVEGGEILRRGSLLEKNMVLSETIPLKQICISGVMQPGKYEIPFQVPLAIDLPATTPLLKCEGVTGEIQYGATVKIESIDSTIPTLTQSVGFTVKQPLLYEKDLRAQLENAISSCLCSAKGISSIVATMPKSGVYYREEPLAVKLNVDSSALKTDILYFRARLLETLTLVTSGGPVEMKSEICNWKTNEAVKRRTKAELQCSLVVNKELAKERFDNLETITGKGIKRAYTLEMSPHYDAWMVNQRLVLRFTVGLTSAPSKIHVEVAPAPASAS